MTNTVGFHVGVMLAAAANPVGAAGVFTSAAVILYIVVISVVLVRG